MTVDAICRSFPKQAMRVDEPLDLISTGSREELEMWVAKAAEQFGMCVSDKAELVDWDLERAGREREEIAGLDTDFARAKPFDEVGMKP